MSPTSTNAVSNQGSPTHPALEVSQSNELEHGFTNEDGSSISSGSAHADGSSPAEAESRLHLDQIDETEDSYESVMSRINNWRETTSSDIEVPFDIVEETPIPEVIEEQREESTAEIELRQKLALLQSLLNEQNEENDSLDDSDDEQFDKKEDKFQFLMGQSDFKDLLFLQILNQCSPFSSNDGVSKAFGKCAHLLRTSEATKEYFGNLGINSGKRLLRERYLLLKSWITTKGFCNVINSSSQDHEEEIRELMQELIEEEIAYTTHKQSRDIDQPSLLSGSSYGSVSSCESSFESESCV
ncbi:uncharacterized protein MELLADRAFT_104992 [Melampsora larici-populina 98AG31]|uniref:Uncharacterized protein n=1 Tax=Melampsora larici-populina (strain 98AG31 / pathotype 3-4-7) TaxID=747676 RepID=F4RG56_MELLP|nr:uncharacterized protein MELLADRAFT_104992 [Melampsora larici-populina 98AG31]EGG08552.1 hypothetical protein MELLADRAFT_104992 [Melampsora larici-populina 98AG31]